MTFAPDQTTDSAPILPLHGVVLFPGMLAPLLVRAPEGILAVAEARDHNRPLGCFLHLDDTLAEIGCRAELLRSITLADGTVRVLLQGRERVRRVEEIQGAEARWANLEVLPDAETDPVQLHAAETTLRQNLQALLGTDARRPKEMVKAPPRAEGPARLADYAAGMLQLPLPMQQVLLEEVDLGSRLEVLSLEAAKALELVHLSNDIQHQARMSVDRKQRHAFLREQIAIAQQELGTPTGSDDLDRLSMRLEAANMPRGVLEEARRELERLRLLTTEAAEYSITRNWLETLASLPWDMATVDDNDISHAREILEAEHHALEEPKQRILEYLAVRTLNPQARGVILCLVGPPGVGKTSLVDATARALGRSFQKIALGGVRDEAEIRGHRRTYIGAMPGRIMSAVRRAGTRNPVLLFDEIDKLCWERGNPAAALLEVLDPSQNQAFEDHYLGVPFDLSQVLFIATANVAHNIPPALLDRLEVIQLPGYTEGEKVQIAHQHLLPRVRQRVGLTPEQLKVSSEAIEALVRDYTREPGVRTLERELERIFRRMALRFVEGRKRSLVVREKHLAELLGPAPYRPCAAELQMRPGVAMGLAWTPSGGAILHVEAAAFEQGRGDLRLTGSMGNVMQESVQAARSLLRSRARELGIDPGRFPREDLHLHCPNAGIPKDGPSAGLAMLGALWSLMADHPLPSGLAMSGEITLRGRVMPVGGIKEKLLAARRAGLRQVILPQGNRPQVEAMKPGTLSGLQLHFVLDVEQAFALWSQT
ncbi:MAG: endopeptidase La [Myxococcota bacterium]|nr:endopeptidase La [Myxococcota bacterium]